MKSPKKKINTVESLAKEVTQGCTLDEQLKCAVDLEKIARCIRQNIVQFVSPKPAKEAA